MKNFKFFESVGVVCFVEGSDSDFDLIWEVVKVFDMFLEELLKKQNLNLKDKEEII